jgi:hypothetical protein
MKHTQTETNEPMFLRGRAFWAERLDLCAVTLLRAYKRGDLEGYRVGDRVLHSPEQIQDWVRGRAENRKAGGEER